jgi:hypothetical protein
VTFSTSGFSSPPNTFSLAVTVTYTPSDPGTSQNCLDVAIEDSTASTVFASQGCVGSGTTVTALNTPAGTYTVEIDSDGVDCCALTSQPFSATVTGAATIFKDPAYLGGPAAFNGTLEAAEPATEPANGFVPYNGQPLVVQGHLVGREAAEPSIGVDSGGNVFFPASTFDTPGGVLARTKYFVSSNQGQTWSDISPSVANVTSTHQFSLDPGLHLDKTTGRVFAFDATLAAGAFFSYSDNQGQSWTNTTSSAGGAEDHPTVATGIVPAGSGLVTVGYPNIVYYCVNSVTHVACSRSLDGGTTFTPTAIPFPDHIVTDCGGSPLGSSLMGHLATDPAGRVFLPSSFNSPPCTGQMMVAVSNDGGTTWNASVVVSTTILSAIHDGAVASDAAGNIYIVWQDAKFNLPYLSVSTNHGASWSTPRMIAPPGVVQANIPTIDAGAPGRIAISFPGTTSASASDPTRPWSYFELTSTDALDANPLFVSNVATIPGTTSPIIHRGACTGRCGGLFDFFEITAAPIAHGPAWASLSDDCTGDCATNPIGKTNDPSVGQGLAVQEVCGPALLGSDPWVTGTDPACPALQPGTGVPDAALPLTMPVIGGLIGLTVLGRWRRRGSVQVRPVE